MHIQHGALNFETLLLEVILTQALMMGVAAANASQNLAESAAERRPFRQPGRGLLEAGDDPSSSANADSSTAAAGSTDGNDGSDTGTDGSSMLDATAMAAADLAILRPAAALAGRVLDSVRTAIQQPTSGTAEETDAAVLLGMDNADMDGIVLPLQAARQYGLGGTGPVVQAISGSGMDADAAMQQLQAIANSLQVRLCI